MENKSHYKQKDKQKKWLNRIWLITGDLKRKDQIVQPEYISGTDIRSRNPMGRVMLRIVTQFKQRQMRRYESLSVKAFI